MTKGKEISFKYRKAGRMKTITGKFKYTHTGDNIFAIEVDGKERYYPLKQVKRFNPGI